MATGNDNTTNPTSINVDALIQTLDCFEGKEDQSIEFFLEQFQEFANITKLPDELNIVLLKAKLAGNAKRILMHSPELRNEKNYEQLKNKLLEHFKSEKSFAEAQNAFINNKQSPKQTIDQFARNFTMSAHNYLANSGHAHKDGAKAFLEVIKLTKFIEGLRPDIAFEVRKAGPETFKEALAIAKRVEIALTKSDEEQINNITSKNTTDIYQAIVELSSNHDKQIAELQEQLNNIKITDQKPKTEREQVIFCHICEKSNHSTSNCFFNSKNKGMRNTEKNPRPYRQNTLPTNNVRPNLRTNNFTPQYMNYPQTFQPTPNQYWQQPQYPQQGYNHLTQNSHQTQPMITFPQNGTNRNRTFNNRGRPPYRENLN